VIAFVSDHGDMLGDHWLWWKGGFHYQGCTGVPLFFNWPGQLKTGKVVEGMCQQTDVMPTLLDLAGLDVTDGLEVPFPGRSLVPTFAGDTDWERELWWYHEGNRALRYGDWKIVAVRDKPWELFDIAADRTESHNLAGEQAGRVSELEARWESILDDIRKVAPVKDEEYNFDTPSDYIDGE